jgi:hypothetical protein
MNWQVLFKLLRNHPAVVCAVFAAGLSGGGYLLYAELSHAQTANNKANIDKLIEYQRGEIERLNSEKAKKEAVRREVVKLCLAGTITDKKVCAEATAGE